MIRIVAARQVEKVHVEGNLAVRDELEAVNTHWRQPTAEHIAPGFERAKIYLTGVATHGIDKEVWQWPKPR